MTAAGPLLLAVISSVLWLTRGFDPAPSACSALASGVLYGSFSLKDLFPTISSGCSWTLENPDPTKYSLYLRFNREEQVCTHFSPMEKEEEEEGEEAELELCEAAGPFTFLHFDKNFVQLCLAAEPEAAPRLLAPQALEFRFVEVLLINNNNSSQFTCSVLCRWLEECLQAPGARPVPTGSLYFPCPTGGDAAALLSDGRTDLLGPAYFDASMLLQGNLGQGPANSLPTTLPSSNGDEAGPEPPDSVAKHQGSVFPLCLQGPPRPSALSPSIHSQCLPRAGWIQALLLPREQHLGGSRRIQLQTRPGATEPPTPHASTYCCCLKVWNPTLVTSWKPLPLGTVSGGGGGGGAGRVCAVGAASQWHSDGRGSSPVPDLGGPHC
uniref:Adhesion G protein-coupled receptor B N-terminal domain-containing protein n=1 Tax=Meleagris gallopavo TaxID=9103 RepID=A0A803XL47_MELGA